jgi:hypothetical protein
MAQTTRMLTAAGAGTVNSTDGGQLGATNGVLKAQRVKDKSGLFQASMNAGQTVTLTLYGRSDPTAPWATVATITNVEMGADLTFTKAVVIFPEMYVKSVQSAGAAPAIEAWITE